MGPAFFGCIFYLFHVNLNNPEVEVGLSAASVNGTHIDTFVPSLAQKVCIVFRFIGKLLQEAQRNNLKNLDGF
jgi:hypothetical protein